MKKTFLKIFLILSLVLLSGCKKQTKYKTGVYEGTGIGYAGPIHVSVTISSKGDIEKIEVLRSNDASDIEEKVFPMIIKKMIDKNTYNVDAVSNATATSTGVKEAVENALKKAR